jgi:hypothetical protein
LCRLLLKDLVGSVPGSSARALPFRDCLPQYFLVRDSRLGASEAQPPSSNSGQAQDNREGRNLESDT